MEQFLHFFKNPEIMAFFLKSTDSCQFNLILVFQSKSPSKALQQMLLLCDSHLRVNVMFGLIFKKCHILEKSQICQNFHTGFGRVFSDSNFLNSLTYRHYQNNANAKGYLRPLGFPFNLS